MLHVVTEQQVWHMDMDATSHLLGLGNCCSWSVIFVEVVQPFVQSLSGRGTRRARRGAIVGRHMTQVANSRLECSRSKLITSHFPHYA